MTTISRRQVLTVGPLALCGLLVACGTQPSAGTSPSASPAETTGAATATAPASPQPAASADTSATPSPGPQTLAPQEEAAAAAMAWLSDSSTQAYGGDSDLVITAWRAGQHPGFDRVVLQFSGTGTPGWAVEWVEAAHTQGKGEPINVEGANRLLLRGTGVTMPIMPEQQVAYQGPTELSLGGKAIGSTYLDPVFEGQFQLVIGAYSRQYRVFTLSSPTRLVVDVAHPQAAG
ncbi:Uncharacterised protein [Actinomyces bovis]|uniref:AMIN-like domain-containing protein n=1 Tax=Actinomyces bovis TaxID=1658 RepID=A0ABY1VKI4_9ACTO|nr:hypothetical protein [Actinomyces bovis]SPT52604.1 Uncharacterised protein [Actinomyces bovis]VEG54417.1 Uncharacterised protein [Actinomyces israelii]